MTDMPEQIFAKQGDDEMNWRGIAGSYVLRSDVPSRTKYIRADLVAAKDQEIETLAEASLRDMREIARLRELLKARDQGSHEPGCPSDVDFPERPCDCGHAAVAAYFREVRE